MSRTKMLWNLKRSKNPAYEENRKLRSNRHADIRALFREQYFLIDPQFDDLVIQGSSANAERFGNRIHAA